MATWSLPEKTKQSREESTDAWRYSAEAGEKHFDFEERVKLINPRITAEGYKIGTRGFTNYILHADDMIKA